MTQLIVADDLNRLPAETRLRLFDPNGTGEVDTAFLADQIGDANSEIESWLNAYFPALVAMLADGSLEGSIDRAVKRHGVAVACYFAAKMYPGAGAMGHGPSPYKAGYDEAKAFFHQMAADWNSRPPKLVGKTGIAKPVATLQNDVDEFGHPTNPWNRVANREDLSGF